MKIGNTIPRGVCVLNQHYGVQKNHQLLRTPEALKIIEAVYFNGVIFVILILIIVILTNLEMCLVTLGFLFCNLLTSLLYPVG